MGDFKHSFLMAFMMGLVTAHSIAAAAQTQNILVMGGRVTIRDCGKAPHCVSTKASSDARRVAPIAFAGSQEEFHAKTLSALQKMPNAKIIKDVGHYLAVEFQSKFFKFTDDFEIQLNPEKAEIDLRSESRVGYYDFGVNKKRVEKFRELFLAL